MAVNFIVLNQLCCRNQILVLLISSTEAYIHVAYWREDLLAFLENMLAYCYGLQV